MIYITRKENFSASHQLCNPDLSPEKNIELFEKCHNIHGHNYSIEVTVAGEITPESGYVMDFKELKSIIREEIIHKVDHKHLNDLEMFTETILTAENMVKIFWNILEKKIQSKNVKLDSIKLFETDNNFVIYRGKQS
jgi:6-pyruvoyltetrahydropterin/6-carboxytetrahydropterin synthase